MPQRRFIKANVCHLLDLTLSESVTLETLTQRIEHFFKSFLETKRINSFDCQL